MVAPIVINQRCSDFESTQHTSAFFCIWARPLAVLGTNSDNEIFYFNFHTGERLVIWELPWRCAKHRKFKTLSRCVPRRLLQFFRRTSKIFQVFSPPARWGLLDFMSVASSCLVLLLLLSSSPPRPPRPPCHPCRPCRPRRPRRPRPTATRDPQCSLPDLNHDHPRPVFPAGPQPRPATPSVPCRTSTTTSHAQCSLPDLNREYPRQVFPAGPHVGRYGTKNVQKKVRKNVRKNVRRYARRYAR